MSRGEDRTDVTPPRDPGKLTPTSDPDRVRPVVAAAARALPWRKGESRRNEWFARLGNETWYLLWDWDLKNRWSALHAFDGKPYAKVTGAELEQLVEDAKEWILANGGEIPRAPVGE